ncbi:hypothetical protein OG689_37910 [Kitasatospora sp. NBC_00240]|nr:hypothetical protein [Kitasatospora sp. NBC_00240]MCX5214974.1 hypothetical protein [Kitasatospora sp. NBC_00240]
MSIHAPSDPDTGPCPASGLPPGPDLPDPLPPPVPPKPDPDPAPPPTP